MISVLVIFGLLVGILGISVSQIKNVCGVMTAIILFLAMIFNNGNMDYRSYSRNYYSEVFERDGLFSLLESFSLSQNFSYAQFYAAIMGLGLVLIFITVKRLKINPAAFCILYFLYPFCLDVIQVRNFLAYSIVFFALPWLIDDDKKNKFFYSLAVFIASFIHLSCVVYIFLIFYESIKKSKKAKIIYVILTTIFILSTLDIGSLGNYLLFFQTMIENHLNETRVYEMSINDIGKRGFLIYYGIHFANILLQFLGLKFLCNQEKRSGSAKNKNYEATVPNTPKRYIEIVMWLNIVLTVFIPLYRFQSTLFRLTRNLMIINYSGYLVFLNHSENKKQRYLLSFLYVALVVFLFWFEIYRGNHKRLIFDAVLQNNWLN